MKISCLKILGFLFIIQASLAVEVLAQPFDTSQLTSRERNLFAPEEPEKKPEATDTKTKDELNKTGAPTAAAKPTDKDKETKQLFMGATYENFADQKDYELFNSGLLSGRVANSGGENSIDPSAISLIQSTFLTNISAAFSKVANYALNLLYLFAVLELVVLGFVWAMQRDVGWDKLFFKVIKIGLILFIIRNYAWLLDIIMQSFAKLAGIVVNRDVAKIVFNPAKIWQYGYNFGIYLLQLATVTTNFSLALVQISLGMGILLVFGLLGIQMVVQIVGFYLVALGALILLPFGAFVLGKGMFDRAVQAVFQAGMRLMTLIVIMGIAVVVWDGFRLDVGS